MLVDEDRDTFEGVVVTSCDVLTGGRKGEKTASIPIYFLRIKSRGCGVGQSDDPYVIIYAVVVLEGHVIVNHVCCSRNTGDQ